MAFERVITDDGLVVVDNVQVGYDIARTISTDALAVADSVQAELNTINPVVDDTAAVSDSVQIELNVIRPTVDDALAVTDGALVQLLESLAITNARSLNATRVRIDFTDLAVINDALEDPASYQFTEISAGAIPVVAQSVDLPPGQPQPAFVEIVVNEMTDNAIYEASLVGALVSKDGEPSIPTPFPFAGIGDSPDLFLVLALDKNTAQVQFTEPMEDNTALRDTGNYSFDGGLGITSVESVEGSRVTLKTTDQAEGQLYNLTVRGILAAIINDKITVTDFVDTPIEAQSTDSIAVTDAIAREAEFERATSDAAAVTDSTVRETDGARAIADAAAVTDSAARELDVERTISDTVVLTEQLDAVPPNQMTQDGSAMTEGGVPMIETP